VFYCTCLEKVAVCLAIVDLCLDGVDARKPIVGAPGRSVHACMNSVGNFIEKVGAILLIV